jgi:hypothetical protein
LYATRNLRNWLQTASLTYSVKYIRDGGTLKASKGVIYTPNKKDNYVVCTNAGLVFAVFVPEREMLLAFVNADPKVQREGIQLRGLHNSVLAAPMATSDGIHKSPRVAATHADPPAKKKKKRDEQSNIRMSPALFSTWFIRSNEKMPDMREWPDYAYGTWVSLQMNAVSIDGDYRLSISIPRHYEHLFNSQLRVGGLSNYLGNFGDGKRMKDRGTVRSSLLHAIKTGMTRERVQSRHFRTIMGGHASGPRMEDMPQFRKSIQGWTKNPRTRKKLEIELPDDGKSIQEILDSLTKSVKSSLSEL